MSESSSADFGALGPSFDSGEQYEHVVVETDDGASECTIFPHNCEEEEILTRWITAGDGAFASLAAME